jgi:hypothetical protein
MNRECCVKVGTVVAVGRVGRPCREGMRREEVGIESNSRQLG